MVVWENVQMFTQAMVLDLQDNVMFNVHVNVYQLVLVLVQELMEPHLLNKGEQQLKQFR